MNIAAILASPHGVKGNTSVLASWLLHEAEQAGARITGVSLSDCDVEPCLGCDKCIGSDDCSMDDDFGRVCKIAAQAEGIVLASPMHFFNCSSYMKTFIDRCRGLLMRQSWKGKYGAVVMSSADTDCRNAAEYLAGFLRAAGCWTVGSIYATVSSWRNETKREQSFDDSRKLGRNLVSAIRKHRVFEEQQIVVEAYRNHLQCIGWPSAAFHGKSDGWVRWEKVS